MNTLIEPPYDLSHGVTPAFMCFYWYFIHLKYYDLPINMLTLLYFCRYRTKPSDVHVEA